MGVVISILVLIVYFVINGILAGSASDIAADKGYDKKKWFHMCFWLGLFAYLIIAGMPDLVLRQQLKRINHSPQNAAGLDPKPEDVHFIQFGSYPQSESGTDNTPIEWQVLKQEGGYTLMISRYALDAQPYNVKKEKTDWERCSLRRWLNQYFYDRAFSAEEKQSIIPNDRNNVFLLSFAEAQEYFCLDGDRMCSPTQYASHKGAFSNANNKCWWWLNSPGYCGDSASFVRIDGSVSVYGGLVHNTNYSVRPAVWVKLS